MSKKNITPKCDIRKKGNKGRWKEHKCLLKVNNFKYLEAFITLGGSWMTKIGQVDKAKQNHIPKDLKY